MIIGITGSIGTGKSTICKYLEDKNLKVINVDYISHKLLNEDLIINQIKERISEDVIVNNMVDRKKLSHIVFNDNDKLNILNDIMHNKIIQNLKRIIKNNVCEYLFVEVPLLFELNLKYLFDYIACAYVDEKEQLKRILKRDNRSIKEINNIISKQLDMNYKIKNSDFIINTLNYNIMKKDIENMLKRLYEYK